ncbi:MAG: sigma-70 family RNA polymerase sigma factor [Acidobacteriota bacterium]
MAAPIALDGLYEEQRRFLWSLCYRMTGSAADAEDVVQDTFVRAIERPPRRTDEPLRPWLVKVALNLARDLLRRRRRRDYIGPWLPSPIETELDEPGEPPSHEPATFEGRYDLLESVSFAFLVALETLTPTARGVLILRDVFDYSVRETADALDLSEANVKTSHHRARKAMAAYDGARQPPTAALRESTRQALVHFLEALEHHDVDAIETLLAEDVRTTTDGGGEFRSALRTIEGREHVMRFYLAVVGNAANGVVRILSLNGVPSAVADIPAPGPGIAPRLTLTAELNHEGKIAHIYVVSATAKLTALR